MSRTVVFELVQALKFKTNIPDDNLLKLVQVRYKSECTTLKIHNMLINFFPTTYQFIIQDAGGTLGPSIILEDMGTTTWDVQNMINTSASECMRQYFNEALDFIADVHTLSKIKVCGSHQMSSFQSLTRANEDVMIIDFLYF